MKKQIQWLLIDGSVFFCKTKPISAVTAVSAVNKISAKNVQKCSKVLKSSQKFTKSYKNSHKPLKTMSKIRISVVRIVKTKPISKFTAGTAEFAEKRIFVFLIER